MFSANLVTTLISDQIKLQADAITHDILFLQEVPFSLLTYKITHLEKISDTVSQFQWGTNEDRISQRQSQNPPPLTEKPQLRGFLVLTCQQVLHENE